MSHGCWWIVELEMPEPANTVACSIPVVDHMKKKTKAMLDFFLTELGRVLAGLAKGLLVGLEIIPLRKKRFFLFS